MDSSSIPNACNRCFQASQEILLLHSLLGSEQYLQHWVLASTVLQSSPPLLWKTCDTQGRWTRPCMHSLPVDHQELRMQASSLPLCTSEVWRFQLCRCNLSCKRSSCRTLEVN